LEFYEIGNQYFGVPQSSLGLPFRSQLTKE